MDCMIDPPGLQSEKKEEEEGGGGGGSWCAETTGKE